MRRALVSSFAFGLLFPLLGTVAECARLGDLSFAGAVRAQAVTPLLWLIDSAPVVITGVTAAVLTGMAERARGNRGPESDSAGPLGLLLVALWLLPTALLTFALVRNAQSVSANHDINRAGSLRYRALKAYAVSGGGGGPEESARECAAIATIREELRRKYPTEVGGTDAAYSVFLRAITRANVAPPGSTAAPNAPLPLAVREMWEAANGLTEAVEARYRALAAGAGGVFVVSLAALFAAAPLSLTVVARLRQAEGSLRRSEARLTRAQEVAGVGWWELDLTTGVVNWSPEVARLLGLDPEEKPDMTRALTRYHPDDVPLHDRAVGAATRDGEPYGFDFRVILADGSTRWLHTIGQGTKFPDGKVARLTGTIQDITARKMAEERLALALDATADGLFDWEIGTGKLTLSRAWRAMFGYEAGEFADDFAGWAALCHPDDEAEGRARLTDVLSGAAPVFSYEHRVRHRDGHYLWVRCRSKVVERDADGTPRRLVGTHANITARKEAEVARAAAEARLREKDDRLRQTVESVRLGLWGWDVATGAVDLDDRWWGIHGYAPGELPGRLESWDRTLHPDDRDRVYAALNAHLADPANVYEAEYRAIRGDGSVVWVMTRGSVTRTASRAG
jgi:PAS domain S-box-containing protein